MDFVGTITACGGPFFVLPEQSILLQHWERNGETRIRVYPLQECVIGYETIRSIIKISWRGSTAEIEFLETQEYNTFQNLISRAVNRNNTQPTTPTVSRSLSFSSPSSPSPSPSPSSPSPLSPSTSSSSASDRQRIVDLEIRVAELSSLLEYQEINLVQNSESNTKLKNQIEQQAKEIENLTSALLDALNQPPPAPPLQQEKINAVLQTNADLVESQKNFKQQRESLQESIALFTAYAVSLKTNEVEDQIDKSKNDYESLLSGISGSAGVPVASSFGSTNIILKEARAKYTQQLESNDPAHIDLARAYYTVFYDLSCKENATRGQGSVSATVMEESRSRLTQLNRSQDAERLNFLHQIQDVHHAKEVIYLAELKIRNDAKLMQDNICNLEIRAAYERLLYHVHTTRKLSDANPVKCFISYAWPQDRNDREQLQKKLKQIRDDLLLAGIEAQLDLANMQGNIPDYMTRGIQGADRVILICTPRLAERAAETSNNLVTELNLAIDRLQTVPGFIVPLLLSGSASTSIPKTIGGKANVTIENLLFIKMTHEERYEDAMVQLEPLGLIPMLLGLGDNRNTGRATYSVAFDRN